VSRVSERRAAESRLTGTDWQADNHHGSEALTQAIGRAAAVAGFEALLAHSAAVPGNAVNESRPQRRRARYRRARYRRTWDRRARYRRARYRRTQYRRAQYRRTWDRRAPARRTAAPVAVKNGDSPT